MRCLISHTILEIAIPLHLDRTFHYRVPPGFDDTTLEGRRVFVPFGRRHVTGYVIGVGTAASIEGLKEIAEVLDDGPLWTARELDFFRWVSQYYRYPLGHVLKTALPSGINPREPHSGTDGKASRTTPVRFEQFYQAAGNVPPQRVGTRAAQVLQVIRELGDVPAVDLRRRFGPCSSQLNRLEELGLVTSHKREVYRDPFRSLNVPADLPRQLGPHQQQALDHLIGSITSGGFHPLLLQGVTGSGKTEVYLQSIAHLIGLGKRALVLVPEISLTPQMVRRFRARFREGIAVLHSGLSDGERYDEWRRIRRGQVSIVIGARSAIFAPLESIGLIVVDEEHEPSFKQADGLRYNARDLALVRGSLEKCPVLLGSATPQVTSIHASRTGKLGLITLPERVASRPMPTVETISMQGQSATISHRLADALRQTLADGRQAMVFLNRRGFATFLVCTSCGEPLSCPDCSVTLTYHRQRGQSICHYCDYAVPAPGICPACGGPELKELGAGTERVEQELKELLPGARILRMDSDTTSGRGGHERLLSRMAEGSADILIGTQMIAKGHDFPGVTLVGVINGDAGLNMPDFRSSERTFQLLSQIIGRAGRGEQPGHVLVQARNPDHYAISCAVNHDSEGFYRQELEFRREAGYPPFSHLACLAFSGTGEDATEAEASAAARALQIIRRDRRLRIEVLGPAPAPLYRLRGRFRRQILLKSPDRPPLKTLLDLWLASWKSSTTVRLTVDIDPVDMM